jgi:hypothetical protein
MPLPRLLVSVAAMLAIVAPACSPSSTGGGGGSNGTGTSQASVCAGDPRATPYAVGLSAKATDGAFAVTFVDAMPAPPTKGENVWTVKISDGSGGPVTGATVTVNPFMPDHGHGSSIVPQVTPMGTDGTYAVSLLDLFMPGIWQVTFDIAPASGPTDTVVFTFCVDG